MRKLLQIVGTLISPLVYAVPAFAQTQVPIGAPAGAIPPGAVKVQNLPQFIINLLFLVGIIIAVAFLIYGGIKWILSGGDKSKVEESRNHIVAAIVGLIIIVAAFFIVQLVFNLLGVTNPLSGTFQLPTLTSPGPTQAPAQ